MTELVGLLAVCGVVLHSMGKKAVRSLTDCFDSYKFTVVLVSLVIMLCSLP